jgi:hypothetical protein
MTRKREDKDQLGKRASRRAGVRIRVFGLNLVLLPAEGWLRTLLLGVGA